MEPANFGKYRVERLLKRGGMASVYLADQPGLNRKVAIKVLHIAQDADLRQRFLREMATIGQLRHQNIVTVYDADADKGEPFLVMEYIHGQNLREAIDRRPDWTIQRRLRIVDELAQGLLYAHRSGVIHRDVKPANVMLDLDGVVKVVDFGIARTTDSNLTQVGAVLGTPSYSAPEQLMGDPVDERTDLFGVGAVAYELLSYEKAFDSARDVLYAEPVPLTSRCPSLSPPVAEVIMRALRKDPEARQHDVTRFLAELRQAFNTAGYSPAEADTVPTPPPDLDVWPTVVSPSTAARQARRRRVAVVTGSLVAGVFALGVLWQVRSGRVIDEPQGPEEVARPLEPAAVPSNSGLGVRVPPSPETPVVPPSVSPQRRLPPASSVEPEPSPGTVVTPRPSIASAPVAPTPIVEEPKPLSNPDSPAIELPPSSREGLGAALSTPGAVEPPVTAAPGSPPTNATAAQRDDSQINAIIQTWAEAMTRRDLPALQELLRDSRGTRPEVARVESWRVVASNSRITFEQDGQRALVRANLAYEDMVIAGQSRGRASGLLTVKLEKRAPGWRIVELRTSISGR